eukprot:gene3990-4365_t
MFHLPLTCSLLLLVLWPAQVLSFKSLARVMPHSSILVPSISQPTHRGAVLSKVSPDYLLSEQKKTVQPFEGFGKGLLRDIKAKAPHYLSDFKDGFRLKTLSSTFFLFFACLAPAIAFGGLLSTATGGAMGTMEAVGATAIGGIFYALFSGQPLTIIGTTGPLLAFLKVLHSTCTAHSLPFLPVYAWIGLWSSLFLYLSALFSTSNLVEYFTKFTDEIFSSLISVIFIFEAVKDISLGFSSPIISGLNAMSSLIVAITTFWTARGLAKLRNGRLFNDKARNIIADFAPTLGVAAGIATSGALAKRYAISLPALAVPLRLGTTSGRPWLVDLFAVPWSVRLLTIFPALMATVLLFMDQNITVRLIMSKKNKLQKGSGIHLDMLVVAAVTTITSLLGMPWMVAATVRSMAHLRSLTNYEKVSTQSGEGGAIPTGVVEQRVSGLLIHSLIAASVLFCRPLLRRIPLSVLTGLFLYLGASSIGTTDLYQRTLLFFSEPAPAQWQHQVKISRAKLFTAIQLALLGGMWYIKGTALGVFFPVLIALLAPIRIVLEKCGIFSSQELNALDSDLDD